MTRMISGVKFKILSSNMPDDDDDDGSPAFLRLWITLCAAEPPISRLVSDIKELKKKKIYIYIIYIKKINNKRTPLDCTNSPVSVFN